MAIHSFRLAIVDRQFDPADSTTPAFLCEFLSAGLSPQS